MTIIQKVEAINDLIVELRKDGVNIFDEENTDFAIDLLSYNEEADEVFFITEDVKWAKMGGTP